MVVCGYPELYDTTSYFYKNRNTFCNETGAACRSLSHDTNSHLLCSEFHARMKRISRANEASKLKIFTRFIRFIRVWCERTFRQPWKYLSDVHELLRFSAKLHRLGSERTPPCTCTSYRQSAICLFVVGHFKATIKCICIIALTVK